MELNSITFPGLPQPYKVTPASHLDDKNNPHEVTPQQIGAHPDTWVPTAEQVGARPNTWTPTAADVGAVPTSRTVNGKALSSDISLSASDVGAAPAGYGLGSVAGADKWNGDANALTKQGWYRLESGTTNGVGASASVRVDGYAETGLTQTAYCNSGPIKQRTCVDGVWSDWVRCDPSAFAPSGYGYGEGLVTLSGSTEAELETSLTSILNEMVNYTTKQMKCSIKFVSSSSTMALVTIYKHTSKYSVVNFETVSGSMLQKKYSDGWQPVEWINPPMAADVEYRTTERIGSKVVYKKNVNGVIQYRLDGETEWKNQNGLVGAAPSGYGLGSLLATPKSDANSAVASGWYYLEPGATNSPNSTYYVMIRSDSLDGNSIVQTAYVLDSYFSKVVRRKIFGTWGAWEWENPPMVLGVEYRTTERHSGKVVYCKSINFGALPESTNKTVAHGITGKTRNLRFAIAANGTARMLDVTGVSDLLVDDTNIDIRTDRGLSYASVVFTLWYTKD